MFNDQLQLASQWPRGASVERHDTEILVKQAVCARCYWRIARRPQVWPRLKGDIVVPEVQPRDALIL